MTSTEVPLLALVPGLTELPRAALGAFPTPVEHAPTVHDELWIKRDDLSAKPLGGNKVRALEFLLGGVRPGERIVTVGAVGSTHALATAIYGRRLGAIVRVLRWPEETNPVADAVRHWTEREAGSVGTSRTVAGAYARAFLERLRGARWIPAGGSTPLGALGHVNAALELARQIERGLLPAPSRIVVPLGSGGTAAGLLLGTTIAGLRTEIIGVRVVPRVVATRARVLRLARGAARILRRHGAATLPQLRPTSLRIVHAEYGGAYGRETASARDAITRARAAGLTLEPTYSGKGLAAALREANDGSTLFWLTFDGRWLQRAPVERRQRGDEEIGVTREGHGR